MYATLETSATWSAYLAGNSSSVLVYSHDVSDNAHTHGMWHRFISCLARQVPASAVLGNQQGAQRCSGTCQYRGGRKSGLQNMGLGTAACRQRNLSTAESKKAIVDVVSSNYDRSCATVASFGYPPFIILVVLRVSPPYFAAQKCCTNTFTLRCSPYGSHKSARHPLSHSATPTDVQLRRPGEGADACPKSTVTKYCP